jgi:hypothetical protein
VVVEVTETGEGKASERNPPGSGAGAAIVL